MKQQTHAHARPVSGMTETGTKKSNIQTTDLLTPLGITHHAGQQKHTMPAGLVVQTPFIGGGLLPGKISTTGGISQTPSIAPPELSGQSWGLTSVN